MASVVFWPISFSLPSECSRFCTLSEKDLNSLDNPIPVTPPLIHNPPPLITIVMGCDESGKPMASSSPQSQINTRLLSSCYHHVCSKQWQGNSSCVDMMLLQLRFPEASSSGSTSIITRWNSSFSSTAW